MKSLLRLLPFAIAALVLAPNRASAQPATVMADPTTGALFRPAASTFISGNSLLTTTGAAAAYQPLDSDLTAIAALTTTANGRSLLTSSALTLAGLGITNGATLDTIGAKTQTGTGNLVLATSPTFTTPNIGAATGTSVNLSGAGTFGGTFTVTGTGTHLFSGSVGFAYAGTQKWHMTATTDGDLYITRSGIADRAIITSDGIATFYGQLIGKGTTTNDNAATGYIGEYVSSTVNSSPGVSLSTGTGANVTSISLTAGDWDVSGLVLYNPGATTVCSLSYAAITSTSATVPALTTGQASLECASKVANTIWGVVAPRIRISISSTTTLYLVANANFTTSTLVAGGTITARRQR